MGVPLIRTPHIDALAARGVLLRNLYIQAPVSRSCIMTGRYASAHGVVDNGYELPATEQTIAGILGANDYFTACVGRTHVFCSMSHPVLPAQGLKGRIPIMRDRWAKAGADPNCNGKSVSPSHTDCDQLGEVNYGSAMVSTFTSPTPATAACPAAGAYPTPRRCQRPRPSSTRRTGPSPQPSG